MNLSKLYIFIAAIFLISQASFIKTQSEEIDREKKDEEQLLDQESCAQDPCEKAEDKQLCLDDEKLKQEILEVVSVSYKDIIDLSALYFCGLIDSDKLYSQVTALLHKNLFKILKLFSWYIPVVLKNKKISTFIKVKKSIYVATFLALFWYSSKELLYTKQPSKGFNFDAEGVSLSPRRRPDLNL